MRYKKNEKGNETNAIALPILIPTDLTTVDIPGSIEIDGDVILNGNLTVSGDVNISGTLIVGDIKAKSLDTESGVSKGGVPYNHP